MKKALVVIGALLVAGVVAMAGLIYSGVYDVSALEQHLAPTYHVLDVAMKRSVKARAKDIVVPPLEDAALIARGRARFEEHCAQCHGAPGIAPQAFALGFAPAAANLVATGELWPARDIYWVVRHGLKMSGMPAWEFRMPDEDLWATVAFVKRLPKLSAADYAAMKGDASPAAEGAHPVDPERGRLAIQQYSCVTCHTIPGIVGANAPVGPSLAHLGARKIIGGHLPNTPANLVAFLREPRKYKPDGAMPDLGVTERDARDMAAWLGLQR